MKKRVKKEFPLIFSMKHASNFIRGEKIEDIKALYNECQKYKKVCKLFNQGLLKDERPLDLSFCKYPPKPHQELPIKILLSFRRAFLFGEVGRGKTYMAGYVVIRRLITGKIRKALIVVPKAGITQMIAELKKFFDIPESWFGDKIIVTNYDGLYFHQEGDLADLIRPEYRNVDMIVCDEAHLIKNPYSVRAAVVAEIMKTARYRILMTGTPIRNQPNDLFFQLSVINPWAFRMSWWHFLNRYFIKIEGKNYVKYEPRPQRLAEIQAIVDENTIKVPKEEKEQENVVFNKIYVNPTDKQVDLARDISSEIVERNGTLIEIKNTIMKLQQVSSGFLVYERDIVERFESPKIEKAIETIEKYVVKNGDQVVVFAKFLETIGRIVEGLHKKGIKVEAFTGRIRDKLADAVIDQFQNGKIDVIVIQIQKGEFALNLQNARRVVFVEYDWTPASIEQAVGRVNRIGQTRKVYVDFFLTKGLMDDRILKTAKSKGRVTARVLRKELAKIAVG